jgi:hypothetical protein
MNPLGFQGRSVVLGDFPPVTVVVGNPWVAEPTDPILLREVAAGSARGRCGAK